MKRKIDLLEVLGDRCGVPAEIIDPLFYQNRNWELEIDYTLSVLHAGFPGHCVACDDGPDYTCYPTPEEVGDMAVILAGNIWDEMDFMSQENLRHEVYEMEKLHRETPEFDDAVMFQIAQGDY